MIDVSICIVTYNHKDKISKVLDHIFKYTKDIRFQVYVVDNQSQDGTAGFIKENYPQIQVIESGVNAGFGHAHNQVMDLIDSKYHVVLNPDIILTSNVFADLKAYMDAHEDVVLSSPRILNPDGTEQYLPKLRPTFRYLVLGRLSKVIKPFEKVRAEYTMRNLALDKPTEIEFCTGCLMFLRTEIFRKIKGFDEQFFMYLEDADLTQRAAEYGKIMFLPDLNVIHEWERASSKNSKLFRIHVQSMIKYLKKQRQHQK